MHRRALVLVVDAFARLFATTLSGQLRTTVSVIVQSVDERGYGMLIEDADDPTWVAAMTLGAVNGLGVVNIPVPLAMMLVDRVLGGSGAGPQPERALSELESTVLSGLVRAGLNDLVTAFGPLCNLQPEVVRIESQGELLKAAPQSESYVVTILSVELPETGAAPRSAAIALPLAGLEPALEAFSGGARRVREVDAQPASVLDHLLETAVDVSLRFGGGTVKAQDVLALTEGQVIRLGHRTSIPLSVDVEGLPFLAAKPGRLGRRLAFAVVDPATELGAASS